MPNPELAWMSRRAREEVLKYNLYRRHLARKYKTYDFGKMLTPLEEETIDSLWETSQRWIQHDIMVNLDLK